jgi:hypothetical protein
MPDSMQATLSVLAMSVASSAAIALGLAPDPATGKLQINLDMAKFNIDLLLMLQAKTKGNATEDEVRFLNSVIGDLQSQFVRAKQKT